MSGGPPTVGRGAHAPLATVVAHRGASGDAPENTLAAIALAAEQGALAVEIDANASRDRVAFVHHDVRLERCTDGSGALHETDADALDALRAGVGRPGHEHEPLPRLEAAIAACRRLGMVLNIEIKPPRGRERDTARAVCEAVASAGASAGAIVYSSFSAAALEAARDCLADVPRALLTGDIPDDWRTALDAVGASNLHCSASGFEPTKAAAIVAAGYGLYVYTVNEPILAARLLADGAHGVFTDYPAALRAALGAGSGPASPPA